MVITAGAKVAILCGLGGRRLTFSRDATAASYTGSG